MHNVRIAGFVVRPDNVVHRKGQIHGIDQRTLNQILKNNKKKCYKITIYINELCILICRINPKSDT